MRGGLGALLVGLGLTLASPVLAADSPLQGVPVPVQPPVNLPSLPVPVPTAQPAPVPVPQVQLPAVPVAPPVVKAPTAPSAPLPSNAPSAARGSTGRVRDTTASPSAPSAPSASGGSGGSGAASAGGSSGSPGASGGSAVLASGSGTRAERRQTVRERRFRRTVRRLSGCLDALPELSRRVLVLRAGVGEQDVLTVAQTARRVDRRMRAVRRIERRALRRLKAADRAGRCGEPVPDGAGAPATAIGGGGVGAGAAAGSELAAAGSAAGGSEDAGEGGAGGSGQDSFGTGNGGDRGGVKGEQRERSPKRSPSFPGNLVAPAGKGIPAVVWLVPVLALAGWFVAARIRRRRRIERMRYY